MTEAMEYVEDVFEDTQKDKYLTFSVGPEVFGLDIKYVIEIIGIQEITQIPNQPEYIKGVINLRGKIIPTMDIRSRFKKPSRDYDDRTCIIVLDINEIPVGIVVDTVVEVLRIPETNISVPPHFSNVEGTNIIKGIGKVEDRVKLLLDCPMLLTNEEFKNMSNLDLEREAKTWGALET